MLQSLHDRSNPRRVPRARRYNYGHLKRMRTMLALCELIQRQRLRIRSRATTVMRPLYLYMHTQNRICTHCLQPEKEDPILYIQHKETIIHVYYVYFDLRTLPVSQSLSLQIHQHQI